MSIPLSEWLYTLRKRKFTRNQLVYVSHVAWLWTYSVMAVIGLLTILVLVFFYVQGRFALQPFDREFINAAAEFNAKLMREDAASALVVGLAVSAGVTPEQAVDAMKAKAAELDIRFIADYQLHQEVARITGEKTRYARVLEFCDPLTSYATLSHNPNFLVHMPCRIALYEDANQRLQLITMNLNLLIHGGHGWEPALKNKALEIQDGLLNIMAAGASQDATVKP